MADERASHPAYDGGLTVGQRIGLLETAVIRHGDRLDSLEDWRAELKGAFRLVTFALGASVVSMVLGVVTIVALIQKVPS